ncbi:RNA 2'-phosphotransferase, partial [Kitasatospora sp. NPDC057512]|uniref:RNA 2'-phosphotransferase n=1 Tax=Kitasatospora sp. NPDC057512 TaxID=3346154 RepID=UPI0036B72873
MMDEKRLVRASKTLSRILRHEPGLAGVVLDAAGWVRVDELLAGLAARGRPLTRAELDHVVATDNKRRFGYSPDGLSIRANQGHT